jgi:ferredoxin-NADP reductase
MAGAAVLGRLTWRVAEVVESVPETERVQTIVLDVPDWPGHRAGQHVDVRLTAEDGYQAQRSYSIASAPEDRHLAITVERLEDGEVSPYLVDELRPGDGLELRGPIGGWFVWGAEDDGRILLIGGGSGVVPLMAMLRHRAAAGSDVPARVLLSSRTLADAIYRDQLVELVARGDGLEVVHTVTRERPTAPGIREGRVGPDLLMEVAWPASEGATAFVCGPTGFVETVAGELVRIGYEADHVRTERFGPTGG